MKLKFYLLIGIFFMLASGLFMFDPVMKAIRNNKINGHVQAMQTQEAKPAIVIAGMPTRIYIPSLDIDLPVIKGYYDASNLSWTLSNDSAQYATSTPQPNNVGGNTFIYAHNLPKLFDDLHKIKSGDIVIVQTDNHKFYYKFRNAYETTPYDTSLLSYKGAPILTLQTCSGLWYQNRQLFTFDFVRVV